MEILFYVGLSLLFVPVINSGGSRNDSSNAILSRHKRYVAFPDGSTIIFGLCMTQQTILPMGIFTEGVNWGIAYELPNTTTFSTYIQDKKQKSVLKRRHRRDLYSKIEVVLDSMGYDGRSCVFRALCESTRTLLKKSSLAEELIRVVFKFPQQAILDFEPEEHRLYHWAYRRGRQNKQQDCDEMFPACPISLVDLALGYYSDYKEELHYQARQPINNNE